MSAKQLPLEELTLIDVDGDRLEAKPRSLSFGNYLSIFVNDTHGDMCGVLLTKDAALALANWLQRAAEELP